MIIADRGTPPRSAISNRKLSISVYIKFHHQAAIVSADQVLTLFILIFSGIITLIRNKVSAKLCPFYIRSCFSDLNLCRGAVKCYD